MISKAGQARRGRLMPGGVPKWIRCYDNGGQPNETIDRYTVVFTNIKGYAPYVGMSGLPYHPQGFCQHGESMDGQAIDRPTYGHLGRKIEFSDLPEDCQRVVVNDYEAYWDLERDASTIDTPERNWEAEAAEMQVSEADRWEAAQEDYRRENDNRDWAP